MAIAELHDEFESRCERGVGMAIQLGHVERLARRALRKLTAANVAGLNQNIPLGPVADVRAAFAADPASFAIDEAAATISFRATIWLHVRDLPSARIVTLEYAIDRAPLRVAVDQVATKVYLEPPGTADHLKLVSLVKPPDADANLILAGFADASGAADWGRFNEQALYPFLWINARNLVRSVFRSIPLPQVFPLLRTIVALAPIEAAV